MTHSHRQLTWEASDARRPPDTNRPAPPSGGGAPVLVRVVRVDTGRDRRASRDQRGHPLPDRARPGEAPDQDAPYFTRPLWGRAGTTGRTDRFASWRPPAWLAVFRPVRAAGQYSTSTGGGGPAEPG